MLNALYFDIHEIIAIKKIYTIKFEYVNSVKSR